MKPLLHNLTRAVQFFSECFALFEIGQPTVAQLPANAFLPQFAAKSSRQGKLQRTMGESAHPLLNLQQLAANLPWYHHVILMEKVKDPSARLWYVQQTIERGWSRNALALMIQIRSHARQGKAVTNFIRTLPPPQSDFATQLLKDPFRQRDGLGRASQLFGEKLPQLLDDPNEALAA